MLAPLEKKLKQAKKEGLVQSEYFGHQIDEAERAEIISAKETSALRTYHEKVLHLLSVDDFSPDELARAGSNTGPSIVPASDADTVPGVQISEPKSKKAATRKASRKKPAKNFFVICTQRQGNERAAYISRKSFTPVIR